MNASAGGSATSKTVCGLTPGLSTSCAVSAIDTAGEGGTSVSNNVYLPCPGESGVIFLYKAGLWVGKRERQHVARREAGCQYYAPYVAQPCFPYCAHIVRSVCNLLSSRS